MMFRIWHEGKMKYGGFCVRYAHAFPMTMTIHEVEDEGIGRILEGAILMQCTHLRDREGILIYESDILEDHKDAFTGYVEYYKGSFGVTIEYDSMFCAFSEFNDKDFVSKELKRIGNIHENPELLDTL